VSEQRTHKAVPHKKLENMKKKTFSAAFFTHDCENKDVFIKQIKVLVLHCRWGVDKRDERCEKN
jgi:hypothetical protein